MSYNYTTFGVTITKDREKENHISHSFYGFIGLVINVFTWYNITHSQMGLCPIRQNINS